MKKIVRNIAGYTGAIIFVLSPVILLFMYLTYSEKVIAPLLMAIMLICGTIIILTDEE
jgi:hypothetical protein